MVKSRLFYFIIMTFCKLSALSITGNEFFVDFMKDETYKITKNSMQSAIVSLDLEFDEEEGEYKLEFLESRGEFSSMVDSLLFFFDAHANRSSFMITKKDKKRTKKLKVFFPPQKIVSAGTYVKKIPLRVYKDGDVILQKEATLFFQVDETLEAKVYAAGIEPDERAIFVDFQQIKEIAKEEVYLDIFTNKNIKVSISSRNSGRMILEGEEEKTFSPYFIPYVVESCGEMIALNTKTLLFTKLFKPNEGKITSKLTFILHPDLKKNFSGKYSDRVCITISSM